MHLLKNLFLTLFVLMLLVGVPVYMYFNHIGAFSYQASSYYGPYFSQIYSFVAPGLSSLESTLNQFDLDMTCPTCAVVSTPTNVNTTAPTFTSFVSVTLPSQTQVVTIGQKTSIFYVLEDTANVNLGAGTSNSFTINYSCGTNQLCQQLTTLGASYKIYTNPEIIYPGNSIEQVFNVTGQCPTSKTLASQLPVQIELSAGMTVGNFSAASMFPVEYINPSFFNSLLSSSQAFVPSELFTAFVSPGPLQVVPQIEVHQPVVANTPQTLLIDLSNLGSGNYYLNNLTVFLPNWTANLQWEGGYTLQQVSSANANFNCGYANGGMYSTFVLPSSHYIECRYSESDLGLSPSPKSVTFTLPIPTLSIASHFDTLPILFYVNYNYTQDYTIPLVVNNVTKC